MSTGEMAYTIGNKVKYSEYFAKRLSPPVKMGQRPRYPGGAVFKTFDDAQAFANKHEGYAVYGLTLKNGWQRSVDDSPAAVALYGYPVLLVDSEIIDLPRSVDDLSTNE